MDQILTSYKNFETEISSLSDNDLLARASGLFKKEKQIGDAILLALKEIKARRIYAALGFGSLFDMLVHYFKLSESATYQRLAALKLIEAVPLAQELLIKGEVSLGTLADTQSCIHKLEKTTQEKVSNEDKAKLVEQIKNKSKTQVKKLLVELVPEVALPEDKEKILTPELTLVQFKADVETLEILKKIKLLYSHQVPDGNLNDLLKIVGKFILSKKELKMVEGVNDIKSTPPVVSQSVADVKGQIDVPPLFHSKNHLNTQLEIESNSNLTTEVGTEAAKDKSVTENFIMNKTSRHIPFKIRQFVFARAQHQCEFQTSSGVRCQSRFQLEVDHRIPFSQGGSNDLSNLQCLCRNHNLYRVKETHGFFYRPTYTGLVKI